MKLTETNLGGLGRFGEAHASFAVTEYFLEEPWDYQLFNGEGLLRVRHDGGMFFQKSPPGGAIVLNDEGVKGVGAMVVWILGEGDGQAFTNFYLPRLPVVRPGTKPKEFSCTFEPESVRWRVEHEDLVVETELFMPLGEVTAVQTVRIRNIWNKKQLLRLMPVVRPYLAPTGMKPWNKAAWYQTCAFTRLEGGVDGFWLEMRNSEGNVKKRMSAGLVTDFGATTFETVEKEFVGKGTWDFPEVLWKKELRCDAKGDIPAYPAVTRENACVVQQSVAAMARDVELAVGEVFEFTQVVGMLERLEPGKLPPVTELERLAKYLKAEVRAEALATLKQQYDELFGLRAIKTPDEALNRYVNEHMALQLLQVQVRGRSHVRGVRDLAQDVTGYVAVEPEGCRKKVLELLDYQRTDGWFLRQYDATSKTGSHDARPYVDTGLWVFELIYEYLVYTRDFALLEEKAGWLDSDQQDTVMTHLVRLFDYYLDPKNIGEHGLCKIREGDWNDSVNAAGLEGRGETVMVTAHAVYCLKLAAELIRLIAPTHPAPERFEKAAEMFKANVLKHALNREGYLNGVFNDNGHWLFSPKDPDGRRRVNSTPNTFAIIAGIVQGAEREKVFEILKTLKGPYGYRLFYPPVSGDPPIEKMGRIGQGDKVPGHGENGCPYNHGSHGFLARAAWSAGKGELFYDVMRYLLPYDQAAHPVKTTKTAPFAIVNNYLEALGQEGHGGKPFVTGSTPVAARNAFDGFLGFRPNLRYLVIDPVMPSSWENSGGHAQLLGGKFTITIKNPNHAQCGVKQLLLDGKETGVRYFDALLGREVVGVPIETLKPGEDHEIVVML